METRSCARSPVQAGDTVVDADGNLVALQAGHARVASRLQQPGLRGYLGWRQRHCQLDQLVVTFKLLDGLNWSDGAAADRGRFCFLV